LFSLHSLVVGRTRRTDYCTRYCTDFSNWSLEHCLYQAVLVAEHPPPTYLVCVVKKTPSVWVTCGFEGSYRTSRPWQWRNEKNPVEKWRRGSYLISGYYTKFIRLSPVLGIVIWSLRRWNRKIWRIMGGNGIPSGQLSLSEFSCSCEHPKWRGTTRTCCGVPGLKEAIYMQARIYVMRIA
jgi:hypothetical protein